MQDGVQSLNELTIVNVIGVLEPMKEIVADVIQELDYGIHNQAGLGSAVAQVVI